MHVCNNTYNKYVISNVSTGIENTIKDRNYNYFTNDFNSRYNLMKNVSSEEKLSIMDTFLLQNGYDISRLINYDKNSKLHEKIKLFFHVYFDKIKDKSNGKRKDKSNGKR